MAAFVRNPKVIRLPAGTLTPEEWDALSPIQRIDAYRNVIHAASDDAVAKSLGVATRTVERWREGTRNISKACMLNMELTVVRTTNYPLKEFLAMNTIAIDPALDVFDRAFVGSNLVALNASCYVLALKVAATAKSTMSRVLVPTVNTCVGVVPAFATVMLSVPGTDIRAEVRITHTMTGRREYIARVDVFNKDTTVQRFAYTVSDKAILAIITRINNYIENNARAKVTKRDNKGNSRKS